MASAAKSGSDGVIVGTSAQDESVVEHNEYTRVVLNRLETLEDAKDALCRTHAVTVMAQVRVCALCPCPDMDGDTYSAPAPG
jgi:hypothetical protein